MSKSASRSVTIWWNLGLMALGLLSAPFAEKVRKMVVDFATNYPEEFGYLIVNLPVLLGAVGVWLRKRTKTAITFLKKSDGESPLSPPEQPGV